MKEIYKNPNLYYVLVPLVVFFWPLLVKTVYLPRVEDSWKTEKTQYDKAQKTIADILSIDPGRLDYSGSEGKGADFNYAITVDKVASSLGIKDEDYTVSSKPVRKSAGQKSQNAMVVLKEIDVTKFTKFLSTIQLSWASLQCEKATLTKKKGLPDTWKVDLAFKYYF